MQRKYRHCEAIQESTIPGIACGIREHCNRGPVVTCEEVSGLGKVTIYEASERSGRCAGCECGIAQNRKESGMNAREFLLQEDLCVTLKSGSDMQMAFQLKWSVRRAPSHEAQ